MSDNKSYENISILSKELLNEIVKVGMRNVPFLKTVFTEAFELIFIPKAIQRQLMLVILLETGAVTTNQIVKLIQKFYSNFSTRLKLIHNLEQQQKTAMTQDEWMDIAEQIDNIQGNDVWRSNPHCSLYESDRISARVEEFVHLMRRRDVFDLMFTLRGGIARNQFGLLHEGLFSKAMAGSKVLVETYHNIVCSALDFVCDAPCMEGQDPIPTATRLAFFNETRHSYGRTALMLSGGAALGFYHVGVVKALMENNVLPRVISGSSAGSIVCAMISTRTDAECRDLYEMKPTIAEGHYGCFKFNFFSPLADKDNNDQCKDGVKDRKKTLQAFVPRRFRIFTSRLYDCLTRGRPKDVLLKDTEHFGQCCRANIGDFTFQEAFDRTGRILNIIVSPQNKSDPPRLLNYLTSPHVLVWSAAVASASLPGIFKPNKLLVKDADGTERYESAAHASFIDGSMEADLPMQQISEMFNVNHFIISQANPHAVLLTSSNVDTTVWCNNFAVSLMHGILQFVKKQIKMWIRDVIELIGGQRAAPVWDTRRGFASQVLTQEYQGRGDIDVSLVPWSGHRSLFSALLNMIVNPSERDFKEWTKAAERETWRYIPKIKSHVAEEMTLDRCVQQCRKKLVLEEAQYGKAESPMEKMTNRVPSFFTSGSLTNMSSLNITDHYTLDIGALKFNNQRFNSRSCGDIQETKADFESSTLPSRPSLSNERLSDIPGGWNGMGLRGNFSNSSFHRSPSGGSGLFLIDDESEDEKSISSAMDMKVQEPGETLHYKGLIGGEAECGRNINPTSMASFYYRRASLGSFNSIGGLNISS